MDISKNNVTDVRLKIEALIQEQKYCHLTKVPDSDDVVQLVHGFSVPTHELIMAKAWTGQMLKCLDVPSPYTKDGKRKTVADIEPEADKEQPRILDDFSEQELLKLGEDLQQWGFQRSAGDKDLVSDDVLVQRIDVLRGKVQELVDAVVSFNPYNGREMSIARTKVYQYLVEAKMKLGFTLGMIRDYNRRGKIRSAAIKAFAEKQQELTEKAKEAETKKGAIPEKEVKAVKEDVKKQLENKDKETKESNTTAMEKAVEKKVSEVKEEESKKSSNQGKSSKSDK